MRFDARELVNAWTEVFPMTEAQRRLVFSDRRNSLFLGGIGSGKTWALINCLLYAAIKSPEGVTVCGFGRSGIDVANVLKPLFHSQRERFKDVVGIDPIWSESKTYGRYTTQWGAQILFRPYDSAGLDAIRGLTIGAAVVDEVERARVNGRDAFEIISGRIRDPRATHKRLWMGSTPNGLHGAAGLWLRMAQREGELRPLAHGVGLSECDHWQDNAIEPCGSCERCDYEVASSFYVVRSSLWDNTFLDAATKRSMSAGLSARQYKTEILGVITTAGDSVFSHEFDESKHVIDWQWQKAPYLIGVDWGTSVASALFVQITERETTCGDVVLPAGSWVVAHELLLEDVSRQDVRAALLREVEGIGRSPVWIAADRAVVEENRWARKTFKDSTVRTLKSRKDQSVIAGVESMRYMLDPYDDKMRSKLPPRLYFARSLKRNPTGDGAAGVRDAMLSYSYERLNGVITNTPSRSPVDPFKHAIDALRYLIVSTRNEPRFHGGKPLPFTDWRSDD